jgi:predicted dehydrogenase
MGTNHRYWRGVVRLVEMVRAGAVGDVQSIRGEIGHKFPDARSEWYREPQISGGGVLIDNGPHLFDAFRHILAACDGDRIRTVRCRTTHERDGLAVEDRASGSLVTERDREIDFLATWTDGPYRMNLEVVGRRGRLALHGFEELTLENVGESTQHGFADVPALESWQRDVDAFVTRLRSEHAKCRFDENGTGLAAAEIVDALYRSSSRNASPMEI